MKDNSMPDGFGKYAPDRSALFLRAIARTGVSRGKITKWVKRQWQKRGSIVDARIRGINYRLNINKNTTDAKILSSSKFYDGAEIKALSDILKGNFGRDSVFIDIGANTGYYSLMMAQAGYSKIIAIEPNPVTLDLLRYNISVNDFGESIVVVPLCIGDGQKIPFYCSGGLGDASVFQKSCDCESVMVDSSPLFNILKTNHISRIDGMKIDIEGYEDRALFPFFESAPKSLWPEVIVIEFCNRDLWQQDVIEMLKKSGYILQNETRANAIFKLASHV